MICYTTAYPERLGEYCTDLCMRTRAFDNQMITVCCTPARNEKTDYVCYGHSMICDGLGRVVKRANDREEIVYHDCGKQSKTIFYFWRI